MKHNFKLKHINHHFDKKGKLYQQNVWQCIDCNKKIKGRKIYQQIKQTNK